jgi:hypothetical protein
LLIASLAALPDDDGVSIVASMWLGVSPLLGMAVEVRINLADAGVGVWKDPLLQDTGAC